MGLGFQRLEAAPRAAGAPGGTRGAGTHNPSRNCKLRGMCVGFRHHGSWLQTLKPLVVDRPQHSRSWTVSPCNVCGLGPQAPPWTPPRKGRGTTTLRGFRPRHRAVALPIRSLELRHLRFLLTSSSSTPTHPAPAHPGTYQGRAPRGQPTLRMTGCTSGPFSPNRRFTLRALVTAGQTSRR